MKTIPTRAWIVTSLIIVACIIASACGTTDNSSAQQESPLAEQLTFTGDISGTIGISENVQPLTHNNPLPAYTQKDGQFFAPAPTSTQCADFDSGVGQDYLGVIVGHVGSTQYVVTIEINEDESAYTNPGTPLQPGNINSGGSIEVYEVGGADRRWQQVYGPTLQKPTIVLSKDKTSGTVDTWLATTDQSQKFAKGTLYLKGTWRCG